jgi:Domain of unknown function (DUF6484)
MRNRTTTAAEDVRGDAASKELERLLTAGSETASQAASRNRIDGVVIGKLVALTNDGTTALVTYRGQPKTAALAARATLDLHAAHMGRDAVLMFEDGDPLRPVVIGCLQKPHASSLQELPGNVEVHADGERLVVSAKDQIVLRCGKASITLTKAGKVIIEGAYVSNRSSGVLRLKGGSVQIN